MSAATPPEVSGDFIDQSCDAVADEGEGCDCFERSLGPHRYLVCHNQRTWYDPRAYCQALGMDLVFAGSEGENLCLGRTAAEIVPTAWWLGHTDEGHEGVFIGRDGNERYEGLWADGEPNNAGGNCAHFTGAPRTWWRSTKTPRRAGWSGCGSTTVG